MTMPSTLLFDYGGTLDTAAVHWNFILLEAYHHQGLHEVDGEAWREAYVFGERALARSPLILPTDDFFSLLLKKVKLELHWLLTHRQVNLPLLHGESHTDVSLSAAVYPAAVPALSGEAAAMAEAIARYCDDKVRQRMAESRSVLETLRERGHRMVLVTNFYGNIQAVLRSYALDGFFDTIVESAVVGVRKPDAAIWRLGVEAAQRTPEGCIAIGDSFDKDILPARAAGCRTVWFKGVEWNDVQRDEDIPDYIITALPEILDLPL